MTFYFPEIGFNKYFILHNVFTAIRSSTFPNDPSFIRPIGSVFESIGKTHQGKCRNFQGRSGFVLQALELTNGEFFNDILQEGARKWLKDYDADPKQIADNLYLKSLGRMPNESETKIILSTLSDRPDEESVQDLFWATLLLPEFQFIN